MTDVHTHPAIGGYVAGRPKSAALYERACRIFPSGVTHDARYAEPFPLYATRAAGSRKWDVDGYEYVDYWMGHGALLLGHNPPAVVAAASEQLTRGTHLGAGTELEVRWGELVQRLVPCAERVKFTSSGTEATAMAIRLSRAFTGRDAVIKFWGHFHGWHDYATVGMRPPFDVPVSAGVPAAVSASVRALPPYDLDAVRAALSREDVACVICEPMGASTGTVPFPEGFLQEVRDLTRRHGTALIFDEVITGFRYAPGGAQEYLGITPDLCALGKIVAGGLPGAAVAGRADIMAHLEMREDPQWNRYRRVPHPGTFNANPLSAAAGVAMLESIADGAAQRRASVVGERLRRGFNDALAAEDIPGCCYGEGTMFHTVIDLEKRRFHPGEPVRCDGAEHVEALLKSHGKDPVASQLRLWMVERGVDPMRLGGFPSAAHTDEDVQETVGAFREALRVFKRSR
ncbi:MAG: aspartate aminotransferase family protein [Armatimonadetes bacterium]|nr:aspartate aminotransferase family protein [Armatimonadota bacterium]